MCDSVFAVDSLCDIRLHRLSCRSVEQAFEPFEERVADTAGQSTSLVTGEVFS